MKWAITYLPLPWLRRCCKDYFVNSVLQCSVLQIAVLRMGSDIYKLTIDHLFNLYNRVQTSTVIIVE